MDESIGKEDRLLATKLKADKMSLGISKLREDKILVLKAQGRWYCLEWCNQDA
jgi:hypothetical protein